MQAAQVSIVIRQAWQVISDEPIVYGENLSRHVSTNSVFLLRGRDGTERIAKISSYGAFEHFIEDHVAIINWAESLADHRFGRIFARPTEHRGHFFAYHHEGSWVTFYDIVSGFKTLPDILNEVQIKSLAREIAELHTLTLQKATPKMKPAKTLKTDVMVLWRNLENEYYLDKLGLSPGASEFLKKQCEILLENMEVLNYQALVRMPVLIDWNLGNFGVDNLNGEFKITGRWDYDWFRFEPSVMDFYFLSRVVRSEGDKTDFSYSPDVLLEERFQLFLQHYTAIKPLALEEYRFIKEAYRFFILNYVIKDGQNFFRNDIYVRLRDEVVNDFLVHLDEIDFEKKDIMKSLKLI